MTFVNRAAPNGKPVSLEKFRETWLRQVVLHRDAPASVIKVAVVLGYHINRKTGLAFPGMRTIAKLTSLSTSTINKAVKWLAMRGYVQIQPGRTHNATNRYLPLLRDAGANRAFAPERTGCSPQGATDLPTYLPNYLPSYKAAPNGAALKNDQEAIKGSEERGIRGSKESHKSLSVSPSKPEPIESPESEAYRLAREYEGELGASRVARALQAGSDPGYVLADVAATVEDGGDLGESLAYHWKESW